MRYPSAWQTLCSSLPQSRGRGLRKDNLCACIRNPYAVSERSRDYGSGEIKVEREGERGRERLHENALLPGGRNKAARARPPHAKNWVNNSNTSCLFFVLPHAHVRPAYSSYCRMRMYLLRRLLKLPHGSRRDARAARQ